MLGIRRKQLPGLSPPIKTVSHGASLPDIILPLQPHEDTAPVLFLNSSIARLLWAGCVPELTTRAGTGAVSLPSCSTRSDGLGLNLELDLGFEVDSSGQHLRWQHLRCSASTMIDLGLARVGRLVKHTPQTWKAIHVAGTNGKGSICAYLSAMLSASGLSYARFTSPHLIDRWDCIAVNGKPVSEAVFRDAEDVVKQRDREGRVGATEFELLTATAFEIFHRQQVEYGVVEVGLGGKLDATNVLKPEQKVATVISKIGLDHQSFLGSAIEEIAFQKAGIICYGVPCVVDGSNQPSVRQVIAKHAHEVGTKVYIPQTEGVAEAVAGEAFEPHQIQNLACAHLAFRLACPGHDRPLSQFVTAIKQMQWPGRLQKLDIRAVTGRPQEVLLDGAHNPQSAEVLAQYVARHLRTDGKPVTWVLAATQGKDMDGIFGLLLKPGDQVAAVRFGPVDGMPWVKPADPAELLGLATRHGVVDTATFDAVDDVKEALAWASQAAGEDGPVVIAGSLYLVSSVLRLLRDS